MQYKWAMSKKIRVSDEAHREGKVEAARQGMTLEDWATRLILAATLIKTSNGREGAQAPAKESRTA